MSVNRVVRLDRCAGVLVGLAAGDALGAGYEFGSVPAQIDMVGGGLGPWEPGEWTDDTQMALCIAEVAATGKLGAQAVGQRFLSWYRDDPKDVGIQTRAILGASRSASDLAGLSARRFVDLPQSSAGNGSLMRTASVALSALGDDGRLAASASEISALTHGDPLAGEACVLWCVAIDRALGESRLDGVRDGLKLLPPDRAVWWSDRLDEAWDGPPGRFAPNGFVVTALQAALAAIWHTPIPEDRPCRHLAAALETAVRIGDDTDTVAAIAGGLLGARWGASAVPTRWRMMLHGWPGYEVGDLVRLAVLSSHGGKADPSGWPAAVDLSDYYATQWHPGPITIPLAEDPDVVLANIEGIGGIDTDVVVSLCRVGRKVPMAAARVEVWLVDDDDPAANPNLDWVLSDLVDAICAWRRDGKRVAIHCVQAERRTPAVAAAYLAQLHGIPGPEAWQRVARQLPTARRNRSFADALARQWPARAVDDRP